MTSTIDPPGGPANSDGSSEPKLTMGIDPVEKNWIRISIALLVGFAAVITVAGFTMGFQVPGADTEVDPRNFTETAPWNEPGLRETGENEYDAYVIARAWSFEPRELTVPVGAKVTIYVSSPDLQHGFKITDTNINMMVVPGQVSVLSHTFDDLGSFDYICHEYCGTGHASMYGTVNVVAELAEDEAAATEPDTDMTDENTDAEGDGQ